MHIARFTIASALLVLPLAQPPDLSLGADDVKPGSQSDGRGRPASPAVGPAARAEEPNPSTDERQRPDPRPTEAVRAILEAFDRYSIVALGEAHGLEEERAFITELVSDPRFPDKVNDIVVEFGNVRFQGVIDRYIAGEDVPEAELQRVWRDHTCPGPWRLSSYPKYFAAFREANRRLPPARRFRVLLGDPPIDWQAVHTREDLGSFLARRDNHFAQVVEEQVLAKGRKALLIIGSLHLLREGASGPENGGPKMFTSPPTAGTKPKAKEGKFFRVVPPGGGHAGNVAHLIERKHPGALFIVLAHDGLGEGSGEIEERFGPWPVPALAPFKGTRLGAMAANQVTAGPGHLKMIIDGKPVDPPKPDPTKGPRLEEVADALLYLGPRDTLTIAPDTDFSHDEAFLAELKRRNDLAPGLMPPRAPASGKQTRRYIDR